MTLILHIIPKDHWQQARLAGSYCGDTLASAGFIHCSTPQQVVGVANRFYLGQGSLVLLCIDSTQVQAEIRYESAEGSELFPHIYGELNLNAVIHVLKFDPASDGTFSLPEALKALILN